MRYQLAVIGCLFAVVGLLLCAKSEAAEVEGEGERVCYVRTNVLGAPPVAVPCPETAPEPETEVEGPVYEPAPESGQAAPGPEGTTPGRRKRPRRLHGCARAGIWDARRVS